ncbi:MAG: hypothetical protein E7561_02550 [Ruminococcaceae bacterium]|nr:hypothetical protein [Oscillospiraceae bacterium]
MQQNESYAVKTELSFLDIVFKLLEKWYVIVIAALVFLSSAFVYVQFLCTPMYSSTAKLFIFNTEANSQSTSELSVSTYLARDYAELIVDRAVLEDVIDNLNLKKTYGSLKSSININNPEGTRILEITVRTEDPKLSKKIVDEVCKVSQQKIVDLMGIDRVNIISDGQLSSAPSSPNKQRYIVTSFFLGIAVAIVAIFVVDMLSDKIESEDDIQKYLDMSVLATIPYANTLSKKKKVSAIRKR